MKRRKTKKVVAWHDYPRAVQLEARLAEYERLRQEQEKRIAELEQGITVSVQKFEELRRENESLHARLATAQLALEAVQRELSASAYAQNRNTEHKEWKVVLLHIVENQAKALEGFSRLVPPVQEKRE